MATARIAEGFWTCTKRWLLEHALTKSGHRWPPPREREPMSGAECAARVLAWLDARGDTEGDLTAATDDEIELAAGWVGHPGAFVAALVACGWIDVEGSERRWHDFGAYNARAISARQNGNAGGRPRCPTSIRVLRGDYETQPKPNTEPSTKESESESGSVSESVRTPPTPPPEGGTCAPPPAADPIIPPAALPSASNVSTSRGRRFRRVRMEEPPTSPAVPDSGGKLLAAIAAERHRERAAAAGWLAWKTEHPDGSRLEYARSLGSVAPQGLQAAVTAPPQDPEPQGMAGEGR